MAGITERQKKFALAYIRLANQTKAAIEAGYSTKSATVTGSQLIRNPNVQAFIEANRIKRDVHADVTYQQMIAIANASMKVANDTINDPASDVKDRCMALEGARRAVETLARCEGLMVELPRKVDEGSSTLQMLAQKIRRDVEEAKRALPAPVVAVPTPQPVTVVEAREVVIVQPTDEPEIPTAAA